jgi:hypothetical protein
MQPTPYSKTSDNPFRESGLVRLFYVIIVHCNCFVLTIERYAWHVFEMFLILNSCKFLSGFSINISKIIRTTHCSYCSNGLLDNVPCISIWFLPLPRYLSSKSGDSCKGQDACWRYARKPTRANIQPLTNPMIKPPTKVIRSCMYFPTLTW